jgi:outer membrane protein OmpA-like peptidoglycan-associated protein
MKFAIAALTLTGLLAGQSAQAPNPTARAAGEPGASTPIYRVTVVARTTKAINYRHRSGSTPIDFRGTALMPDARGFAKVDSKQGVIKIDANMEHMAPASQFGPEYLTYVLWAITPEGRATNVGEILLDGDKSKINATTELQAFGLIITAEPYFAVTQPSDVVVMENFVRKDTTGTIEEIDAKYELLARGQYTLNVAPADLKPVRFDRKTPLELLEARNAVQIARYAGADRYASDTFRKASIELQNGEGFLSSRSSRKSIQTVAREAVQAAEDARIITVKKIADEQLAAERQAAADREASAKAAADAEVQRRTLAEAAQRTEAAERARAEAERTAALAQAQQARTDAQQARNESEQARDEAHRVKQEAEILRSSAEAATVAADRANAEAARANAAADEANQLRQKAESERTELRAQLLRQFNLILETRDSARGLIVNMSDVLFDTGKSTLRAGAREKLAKVSGIIQSHPGLKLEIEGHTDSVGGDEYNQQLSERRAGAVRDYLVQQGIMADSVTAKGFGKSRPVVSNATAEGRQRNRRVEMVVSGDIIGNAVESARATQ